MSINHTSLTCQAPYPSILTCVVQNSNSKVWHFGKEKKKICTQFCIKVFKVITYINHYLYLNKRQIDNKLRY